MNVVCPKCGLMLELPEKFCKNGVHLQCDQCSAKLIYRDGDVREIVGGAPHRIAVPKRDVSTCPPKMDTSENVVLGKKLEWSSCFAKAAICMAGGSFFAVESYFFLVFVAFTFAFIGLSIGRWGCEFNYADNRKSEKTLTCVLIGASLAVLLVLTIGHLMARVDGTLSW